VNLGAEGPPGVSGQTFSHSILPKPCKQLAAFQLADARAADLLPIIADVRASGAASLREIAAGLNRRGILATRGGRGRPCRSRAYWSGPSDAQGHSGALTHEKSPAEPTSGALSCGPTCVTDAGQQTNAGSLLGVPQASPDALS